MAEVDELKEFLPPQKKYLKVYEYLLVYIDQNKFSENNKLPSENFLCRKFSVSRETVRNAVRLLNEEGRISSVRGSGSYFDRNFALKKKMQHDISKTRIGFITQGHDYNTSSNLARGIKHALNKETVDLKIFMTDNKLSNERLCLESCSTGFDGLIIDGVKASIMNPNLDCYQKIDRHETRLLFFNNYYMGTSYPRVIIDDALCADELVRRLTEKGHRHIAGIFMYDNYQGQEKYNGFMRSLLKYGAVFKDEYVKWCISDESYGKKAFPRSLWKFIHNLPKVTAVVCCNYMILKMIQEVFRERSIRVPEDYSIVCFDYSSTDWQKSRITASVHPGFDMGVKVGQTILQMVEDPDFRKRDYSYTFQPRIHEGCSIIDIGKY